MDPSSRWITNGVQYISESCQGEVNPELYQLLLGYTKRPSSSLCQNNVPSQIGIQPFPTVSRLGQNMGV